MTARFPGDGTALTVTPSAMQALEVRLGPGANMKERAAWGQTADAMPMLQAELGSRDTSATLQLNVWSMGRLMDCRAPSTSTTNATRSTGTA